LVMILLKRRFSIVWIVKCLSDVAVFIASHPVNSPFVLTKQRESLFLAQQVDQGINAITICSAINGVLDAIFKASLVKLFGDDAIYFADL